MPVEDGIEVPELILSRTQSADLELILNGGYSPLTSFMTRDEYISVIENHCLCTGENWEVPVVLEVSDLTAERVSNVGCLILIHPEGIPLARIEEPHVWTEKGAIIDYGNFVSGTIIGLADPVHYDFTSFRLTPHELRSKYPGRLSRNSVAFTSPYPINEVDVKLLMDNLHESSDRLLLAPIISPGLVWDRSQYDLVRSYSAVLPIFKNLNVDLVIIPAPHVIDHSGGMKLREVVLRNYGYDRIMIRNELDVALSNADLDDKDIGDEVAFMDAQRHLKGLISSASKRGFTVFFTGLPSSGKSTLANYLVGKLMEYGERSVTLLDGDIVRRNLSSELGFSREDRDVNIRRIGFVASEITKAGGVAVCAPIAPYDNVRKQVREMVTRYGEFIEVFVSTPVDVCELRDRKGLYAKAHAGVIKGFTGVDDPYEKPMDPDIEIDTSSILPIEAVKRILLHLSERGLVH